MGRGIATSAHRGSLLRACTARRGRTPSSWRVERMEWEVSRVRYRRGRRRLAVRPSSWFVGGSARGKKRERRDALVRLELHARAHVPGLHGTIRAAPGEHDLVEKVGDRGHRRGSVALCPPPVKLFVLVTNPARVRKRTSREISFLGRAEPPPASPRDPDDEREAWAGEASRYLHAQRRRSAGSFAA